jgi:hypothetical protein
LTIHPQCTRLKEAFKNYCKHKRGGEWIDFPADGHPEEDMMDALRGGIPECATARRDHHARAAAGACVAGLVKGGGWRVECDGEDCVYRD